MKSALAAAYAAVCLAIAAPASAKIDARIGAVAHNVKLGGGDTQSNESGVNLEAEIIGDRIGPLGWLGGPRPYAMVSGNTNGDTSFGGVGLYWRVPFAHVWTLEPGFGAVVHDGALNNPFPSSDPRAESYAKEHQLLGTRILFRDSLALDRDMGQGRTLGLVYEHLSNGGSALGHRDNQSLNEIGVRFTISIP